MPTARLDGVSLRGPGAGVLTGLKVAQSRLTHQLWALTNGCSSCAINSCRHPPTTRGTVLAHCRRTRSQSSGVSDLVTGGVRPRRDWLLCLTVECAFKASPVGRLRPVCDVCPMISPEREFSRDRRRRTVAEMAGANEGESNRPRLCSRERGRKSRSSAEKEGGRGILPGSYSSGDTARRVAKRCAWGPKRHTRGCAVCSARRAPVT